MNKCNLVVYGFDYEKCEDIINTYTMGTQDFSAVYVNDGVHREDRLLCHLKIGLDIICPFIAPGKADILHAGTWEDAGRYLEWLREDGIVKIERDCENDSKNIGEHDGGTDNDKCIETGRPGDGHDGEHDTVRNKRMKEYILRQEKAGLIKVVYPRRNML